MYISRQVAITIAANDVRPLANGPKNSKWQAIVCYHNSNKIIISSDFIYDTYNQAVKVARDYIRCICIMVNKGSFE